MNFEWPDFMRKDHRFSVYKPFDIPLLGEEQVAGKGGACYSCSAHSKHSLGKSEAECAALNKIDRHNVYVWAEHGQTRDNACAVHLTADSTLAAPVKQERTDPSKKRLNNPRLKDICICTTDSKGRHAESLSNNPTFAMLEEEQQNIDQNFDFFGEDQGNTRFAVGIMQTPEANGLTCEQVCDNTRQGSNGIDNALLPGTLTAEERGHAFWSHHHHPHH